MKLWEILKSSKLDNPTEKIHITVISSISLEPYFVPFLQKALSPFGFVPTIHPIAFEECDLYNKDIQRADYVLVWLYPEAFGNGGEAISEALSANVKALSTAPVFWMDYDYHNDKTAHLTGFLSRPDLPQSNDLPDVVLLDLKRMVAEVGVKAAYDKKSYYRWNAPYGKELVKLAAEQIAKQICIDKGLSPKCLVLDCDNVLWGGILSEDGIDGVVLGESGQGRCYQDFQKFVKKLSDMGVILALCTKNNREDVLSMLHSHSGMMLNESHFSCIEAGWQDKASAILRISETLGIGLSSMVFVDDSAFEVAAVQELLPEVKAIQFDRFTIYEGLSCFNLSAGKSAQLRKGTYQNDHKRADLQKASANFADFLRNLDLQVSFHPAQQHEHARIAELTQRTNRRTNGQRYTLAEIKKIAANKDYALETVYVKDRFGDLGLVGVTGTENRKLDLFCLSCRALGRGVEQKMFEQVVFSEFRFKDTTKNQEMQSLLEEKSLKNNFA